MVDTPTKPAKKAEVKPKAKSGVAADSSKTYRDVEVTTVKSARKSDRQEAKEVLVIVEVSAEVARKLVKAKQAKIVKGLIKPKAKQKPQPKKKPELEKKKKSWIKEYFGIWADDPQDLNKIREEQWQLPRNAQS